MHGAPQGAGRGDQFLRHIRETDSVHRVFADPDVTRVEDPPGPEGDIETIATELTLADFQILHKALPRLSRDTKTQHPLPVSNATRAADLCLTMKHETLMCG